MWNRIGVIYLLVCSCVLSLLSTLPAGHQDAVYLVLGASLSYPFFLAWMKPKTGFWTGALQLLLILAAALLCMFAAYLLSYCYFQYRRLGNEFRLRDALGWTFDESLSFFLYLDVMPAAITVAIWYPIGYLASWLVIRRRSLGGTAK